MVHSHKDLNIYSRTRFEYEFLLLNGFIMSRINSVSIKRGRNLTSFLVTESRCDDTIVVPIYHYSVPQFISKFLIKPYFDILGEREPFLSENRTSSIQHLHLLHRKVKALLSTIC